MILPFIAIISTSLSDITGSFSPDPVKLRAQCDLCHDRTLSHVENIPYRLCNLLRKKIRSFLLSLSKVRISVQLRFRHVRLDRHNTHAILAHLTNRLREKLLSPAFVAP